MSEFSLDWRVGRPVIMSVESMDRLVSCYRGGLVVAERHAWETDWGILPETAAYIVEHMQELPLPGGSDLRLFRWGADTRDGYIECVPDPLSEARATRGAL